AVAGRAQHPFGLPRGEPDLAHGGAELRPHGPQLCRAHPGAGGVPGDPDRAQDRVGLRLAHPHRRRAGVRRELGRRRPRLVHLREQQPARDRQRLRRPVHRDPHRPLRRRRRLPHHREQHGAQMGDATLAPSHSDGRWRASAVALATARARTAQKKTPRCRALPLSANKARYCWRWLADEAADDAGDAAQMVHSMTELWVLRDTLAEAAAESCGFAPSAPPSPALRPRQVIRNVPPAIALTRRRAAAIMAAMWMRLRQLGAQLATGPNRIALSTALRGTIATVTPLALLPLLGGGDLAYPTVLGALNTSMVDVGGSYRNRLTAMALFAVAGPCLLLLGAAVSAEWWLATLCMFAIAVVSGLVRALGPGSIGLGINMAVAFLVGLSVGESGGPPL